MTFENIGNGCQRIITNFAWEKTLTYKELRLQLDQVTDIQESVPSLMLNPVVFDLHNGYLPNPFRKFYPRFSKKIEANCF